MAQNYRSIRNNIQCAVHGRSKRRKKNVMVCKSVFRRVRKGAKGDYKLRHVCVCLSDRPSVRTPARNNSARTGRIFTKFDI
jgi:hypothetical protein